jgi:hypothetical protein
MPSFNSRIETAILRRKQTTPPIFSCANRFLIRRFLSDLNDKDDKALLATANAALEQGRASSGDR